MNYVPFSELWLPILLSAIFVFIVSSIIHMALPYHKSDYRFLPDEAKILDAMRASGVTPGAAYMFPGHTMKDMNTPEVQEKFKRGPVGLLYVRPSGIPKMGAFLLKWFVYCGVISIFAAYMASRSRPAGTEYLEVFRIAGTAAFLGYGAAQAQQSIWGGQPWRVTTKHIFDSLIYGGVTGGAFGWLWPHA